MKLRFMKKRIQRKRIEKNRFAGTLFTSVLVSASLLFGCGGGNKSVDGSEETTWAIYWYLGSALVSDADWEQGIFRFELPREWWVVNDTLVCAFLWQDNEDTALYGIPILYNGVTANMKMLYDKEKDEAEIIGIAPYIDESAEEAEKEAAGMYDILAV